MTCSCQNNKNQKETRTEEFTMRKYIPQEFKTDEEKKTKEIKWRSRAAYFKNRHNDRN
jgi:hypothetical protein